MHSRGAVAVTRWALAFAALAGIVLVYRRWLHVNPTTVAMTLLLLVLLLAAEWGLRYAVAVAVLATACYNFFFLPPVGTFTIADPENWLALFTFLATAIIASRLSERARRRAEEARARQRELEILLRLSRELLQSENVTALVSTAPMLVAGVTSASSGVLYLLDGDQLYRAGSELFSEIEVPHLRQSALRLTGVHVSPGEVQIPVRSGVRPRGVLVLRGASVSIGTAEAIGGLVSIAVDRAQALENVARGEAAKETERLRTLMIDSITHELRTPLTSIKGAATTLLTGGVEQESGRELLTIIDEESDRLNRLVSEAVEMAQLDAKQVRMHFVPVGLSGVVEEARALCEWVEEGHAVTLDIPNGMTVLADEAFLRKVVCNLLENAAKYSAKGSPIAISAEQKGSMVRVHVSDRGAGIDPADQALIFERFYRAKSHSEVTAGTGVGLAISRSIIEAHGGEIAVISQPGQGSVFSFTVPAGGSDAVAPRRAAESVAG